MAAMALGPGHRVVTIASGGCNVLAYLTRDPAAVDAVDLNRAHIALNRLKLTAVQRLPGHGDLLRMFGGEGNAANEAAYHRFLAPHLDVATRPYWKGGLGGAARRIGVFGRNFYRTGLLGAFIAAGHRVAASLWCGRPARSWLPIHSPRSGASSSESSRRCLSGG